MWKLVFIDVKRAHLEAPCDTGDVYVALPDEDTKEGQGAWMKNRLYGMRGATEATGAKKPRVLAPSCSI